MRNTRLLKAAVIFIVMFCMGATGILTAADQQLQMNKGLEDFNYLSDSEFQTGKFVEGYVYEVYGEFAYNL